VRYQQFQALSRKYLGEFEEKGIFRIYRDMIIHLPFNAVLRGVCYQGAAFSKTSFTAAAFAQPLIVPNHGIVLDYGGRFGALRGKGDKWWDLDETSEEKIYKEIRKDIVRDVLPYLEKVCTPKRLYKFLQRKIDPRGPFDISINSALCEDLAFLAVWRGHTDDAFKWLQQGISVLQKNAEYKYEFERKDRLERVLAALNKSERGAKSLLLSYLHHSADAAKLPEKIVNDWLQSLSTGDVI
jgi:hypothetical protein